MAGSFDKHTLEGKTVLVVDDEADLRDIITEELELMGATIVTAGNGREAFDIATRVHPDAIISDVRMPGGDGVELLRRMRDRDKNGPAIILVTGFADVTPDEAQKMGAQAMIAKPFNLKTLRDALFNVLAS